MLDTLNQIETLNLDMTDKGAKKASLVAGFLIFVVSGLMFLPMLGAIDFFDPSDGYYSEAAREMLERGNLIVPVLNYLNYFEKPILNYWLIIVSYKLLGVTPFAARIPAAFAAIGIALVVFFNSQKFIGKNAALMASMIFITSPIVLIVGRFSLTDMPLCLFETAALMLLFEGIFSRRIFSLILGYISIALAVLTKGPVAIIAVVGVLLTLAVRMAVGTRKWGSVLKRFHRARILLGVIIVCLISMPWYVAAHIATSGEFTYTFFIAQNIGRALGKINHTAPWFYYLPIFFGSFFPWSILLLSKISSLVEMAKNKVDRQSFYVLFCTCWVAFTGIFFTVTPTKLPTYILPLYPPCAILLAVILNKAAQQKTADGLKFGALSLSGLGFAVAVLLPFFITGAVSMKTLLSMHYFKAEKVAQTFTGSYCSLELWSVSVAAAAFAYMWFVFSNTPRQAVVLFFGAMIVISICFTPLVIRHFYNVRQAGFARLVRVVKDIDKPVATIEAFQPSASFLLHKHVPVVKTPDDLKNFLNSSDGEHLLLVPDSRMSVLLWLQFPPKIVSSCGGWTLVSVK